MPSRIPKSFIVLFAAILILLSLPKQTSENMRGMTVATLAPAWETLVHLRQSVMGWFGYGKDTDRRSLHIQKLEIENHQLASEIMRLQHLLLHEKHLDRQLAQLPPSKSLKQLKQHHQKILLQRMAFQLKAMPAEVIFRSPSSWSGSMWLNVGHANNTAAGYEIVSKNSPVLVGTSVVGVVDYVGAHQCRVRLITDSALCPSVRVVRGDLQRNLLRENVISLLDKLESSDEFADKDEKERLLEKLWRLELKEGQGEEATWHLAKGELHGGSQPLWRSLGNHLKGVGFNYDFDDEEGAARDLRSGLLNQSSRDGISVPILQVHDLLVTTGMDGVFPAGLYVAEVTKIETLREGDYYYELEAKPTAGNLHELSTVFVIPALGYDSSDQPSTL